MMRRGLFALLLPVVVGACNVQAATSREFVLGLVAPLSGESGLGAREDIRGAQVAVDEVNRRGGVQGHRVRLLTQAADTREATGPAVLALKAAGATVVMGSYSSQLSMPTAAATSAAGLVYWEAGAVADQITGAALPRVFRVGAAGSNLGRGSAVFATDELAPRLHRAVPQLRITVVEEHDAYGDSVAGAVVAEASARGAQVSPMVRYDAYRPDWNRVFAAVAAGHPDVLVLASYIPDGVAFRREMLARGVRVGALIGTTMAECGPEFGAELGNDAIGVFASDRPTSGFNAAALSRSARVAYDLLVDEYGRRFRGTPGEEAVASFTAAWALLHDVVSAARSLSPAAIDAAARAADIPNGALPNGAGLRFSSSGADRGQNLRSATVVWQWQAYRHSVTVWPPVLATGEPALVPLPR